MSIDCDGYCDVWKRRRQRARNSHNCDCCGERIERGHIYAVHFTVYEGEKDYVKRCLRCDNIYNALEEKMHSNGIYGEECPDIRLNCGHSFMDRWGTDAPPELERLAFLTPAEIQSEELARQVKK